MLISTLLIQEMSVIHCTCNSGYLLFTEDARCPKCTLPLGGWVGLERLVPKGWKCDVCLCNNIPNPMAKCPSCEAPNPYIYNYLNNIFKYVMNYQSIYKAVQTGITTGLSKNFIELLPYLQIDHGDLIYIPRQLTVLEQDEIEDVLQVEHDQVNQSVRFGFDEMCEVVKANYLGVTRERVADFLKKKLISSDYERRSDIDIEIKKLLAINKLNIDIWNEIKPSCDKGWFDVKEIHFSGGYNMIISVTFEQRIPDYANQFSLAACWTEIIKPVNNIFKAVFPTTSYDDLADEIKNLRNLNRQTQERLIPIWKDALEKSHVMLGTLHTQMESNPRLFNNVRRILELNSQGVRKLEKGVSGTLTYPCTDITENQLYAFAELFG